MKTITLIRLGVACVAVALLAAAAVPASQGQAGADFISGEVRGPGGPEAGVWVIAETKDLPTKYVKIVVTDDRGRYLIPELPKANYDVWVRGYGLIDSPKKRSAPGATVNHTAIAAPTAKAAAEYYPAGYWYSLMQIPAASEFPGTGLTGNGFMPGMTTQQNFIRTVKSGGCTACHQLGTKATREVPVGLLPYGNPVALWERRIQSGQAGGGMLGTITNMGKDRTLAMFADWTERIAKGEVPDAPKRPHGVERNVVITQWDWADPKAYLHDVVSTDRRKPTVNANGKLYGALELSADYIPVLDPVKNESSQVPLTVRDSATPRTAAAMPAPSPYWGDTAIWTSRNNVHNPMLDERGRVWLTSAVRSPENPDWCKAGSQHPSAKVFPVQRTGRQLAVWDPKTQKLTHISTCYGTHHLMFAEDANNTLWTSGGGQVVGWLNVKMFDETGDEQKSQGWTPIVVDHNGNGKRDEYTEPVQGQPNAPIDPAKDRRINAGLYSVAPAPDGSIWGTSLGYPGGIVRIVPGSDPSTTALAEYYQPPTDKGFSPRGGDVDRNGVMWVALASGHLASFDRRKCKGPLNGPTATTGQHCPEGWTMYTEPMPQFKGVAENGSVEASYYTWVDQFNTLGLGANVPINTGNAAEALLALQDGKWVVMRVPYPMGFYTKWMDGRIDDPNGGWKGRGIWTTISTRAPFHMEGGKGTTSKVMKFQIRPNPLAR